MATTGHDISQAIRSGHADTGIVTRAVATAAGLGFLPLITERFDILLRQRDRYWSLVQTFLNIIAKPAFATHAAELGGLDVSQAEQVRWAL